MSGVVRSERRRGGQGGYSTAEERSSGRGSQGGQGKVRSRPTGTLTDTEGLSLPSSLGGKGFQGGQGKVPSRLTGTSTDTERLLLSGSRGGRGLSGGAEGGLVSGHHVRYPTRERSPLAGDVNYRSPGPGEDRFVTPRRTPKTSTPAA